MQYGTLRSDLKRTVVHATFGKGTVIDTRKAGREIHVRFKQFAMWVLRSELAFQELEPPAGEPQAAAPPAPNPQVAATPTDFVSRALAALKSEIEAVAQRKVAGPTPPDGKPTPAVNLADKAPVAEFSAAGSRLAQLMEKAELSARTAFSSKSTPVAAGVVAAPLVENAPAFLAPLPRQVGAMRNRRMIEALRLGLVAPEEIELFTFHREEEITEMDGGFWELEHDGGAVRVVEGDYGTGKSHFLEYVKSMALKRNCLVMRTELDAFEVQPNRPKRVYNALMNSIATPDQGEIALRQMIDTAAKQEELFNFFAKPPNAHIYLGPALKLAKIKTLGVDGITWGDWIEGDPLVMDNVHSKVGYLPSLYDYYKAGNIYCNIISGIGHLTQQLGYNGLMLMIDEAESLCLLQGYRKQTADAFFKGLITAALGEQRSPFDEGSLLRTKKRPIPYVYKEKAKIFLVMAFTPRFFVPDVIKELSGDWIIELSMFDCDSLRELTLQLWEIYRNAYVMPPGLNHRIVERLPAALYKQLQREYMTLRQVIKMLVETFDMIRHYPQESASARVDELIRNLPA